MAYSLEGLAARRAGQGGGRCSVAARTLALRDRARGAQTRCRFTRRLPPLVRATRQAGVAGTPGRRGVRADVGGGSAVVPPAGAGTGAAGPRRAAGSLLRPGVTSRLGYPTSAAPTSRATAVVTSATAPMTSPLTPPSRRRVACGEFGGDQPGDRRAEDGRRSRQVGAGGRDDEGGERDPPGDQREGPHGAGHGLSQRENRGHRGARKAGAAHGQAGSGHRGPDGEPSAVGRQQHGGARRLQQQDQHDGCDPEGADVALAHDRQGAVAVAQGAQAVGRCCRRARRGAGPWSGAPGPSGAGRRRRAERRCARRGRPPRSPLRRVRCRRADPRQHPARRPGSPPGDRQHGRRPHRLQRAGPPHGRARHRSRCGSPATTNQTSSAVPASRWLTSPSASRNSRPAQGLRHHTEPHLVADGHHVRGRHGPGVDQGVAAPGQASVGAGVVGPDPGLVHERGDPRGHALDQDRSTAQEVRRRGRLEGRPPGRAPCPVRGDASRPLGVVRTRGGRGQVGDVVPARQQRLRERRLPGPGAAEDQHPAHDLPLRRVRSGSG